jgi:hypothetical protein
MQIAENMDIRTVEASMLVDAATVNVDIHLPKKERMTEMLRQMNGNPYFFRSGKTAVQVSYADTDVTFDECLENWLRMV